MSVSNCQPIMTMLVPSGTPMPFLEAASLASRCRDGSLAATLFQHRDLFDLMFKTLTETRQLIMQNENNSNSNSNSNTSPDKPNPMNSHSQTLDIPETSESQVQSLVNARLQLAQQRQCEQFPIPMNGSMQSITAQSLPPPPLQALLPQSPAEQPSISITLPKVTVAVDQLVVPYKNAWVEPLAVTCQAIEQMKRGLALPLTIGSVTAIPLSFADQQAAVSFLRDKIDLIARILELEVTCSQHGSDTYDPSNMVSADIDTTLLRREQQTLANHIRDAWYQQIATARQSPHSEAQE